MTRAQTARVIKATVHLDGKGGQGVLVCFLTPPLPLLFVELLRIERIQDGNIRHGVCRYWPNTKPHAAFCGDVFDIAITHRHPAVAVPLYTVRSRQDEASRNAAVPLGNTTPRFRVPLGVRILTHKGKWIGASIVRSSRERYPGGCLYIAADDRIEGGTSGGPVVDSDGRLVGVVSHSCEDVDPHGKYGGMLPIARLALPRWCWRRIEEGSERKKAKKPL